MKTSVIGYPRIGSERELKFACEKYFKSQIDADELSAVARELRFSNYKIQAKNGIDYIPSGDFSYYDCVLDTAVMLGAVPERYKQLNLSPLDTYFAMARGYQGKNGDVKALAMKKWFNTNYHYIVPEIDDDTRLYLALDKPAALFSEALAEGFKTRPQVIGAYTFLQLSRFTGKKCAEDLAPQVISAYRQLLENLFRLGAEWVQIDEPSLVTDMTERDRALFMWLYGDILKEKNGKVLLQTYFGDVRDCYGDICALPFDGTGLDFVEGKKSLELVRSGFPKDKVLFAGVVNGKNIWSNDYSKTIEIVSELEELCTEVVIGTSCSLLHVPYTVENEKNMPEEIKKHFAFAEQKLEELAQLKTILEHKESAISAEYAANRALFSVRRTDEKMSVKKRLELLTAEDFIRKPDFYERERLQRAEFSLPLFPTTTIGSFPQTSDVKSARAKMKKGELPKEQYEQYLKQKIADCISFQEQIGLDVLVHGEYERNDMVEYFGECLDGYVFTQKAWVQSYGTRCVKPPVIWGDISRAKSMTVRWSVYAQSLTDKPVKGMLTGPVTILNWSFPREDISIKDSAMQIALAVRDEVLDLERNGIRIIQVDEAALREKLPLRRDDWREDYLDWAIPAFRLVHSGLNAQTQLHTHMCYSEFGDIIRDIDDMDADVITFEASRSDLSVLEDLKENNFRTAVGPGVYDIHSPRVPSKEEIKEAVGKMLKSIPAEKLWINPDCGLKTRGESETKESLINLVAAAKELRDENK